MWLLLRGASSQIEMRHCCGFRVLDGSSTVELGEGERFEGYGVVLDSMEQERPLIVECSTIDGARDAYNRIADAVSAGSTAVDLRDIE